MFVELHGVLITYTIRNQIHFCSTTKILYLSCSIHKLIFYQRNVLCKSAKQVKKLRFVCVCVFFPFAFESTRYDVFSSCESGVCCILWSIFREKHRTRTHCTHTHSQITLKFNPLQTNKHEKPKRIENEIKIAKPSLSLCRKTG